MRTIRFALLLSIIVFVFGGLLQGQESRAVITGTVSDPSGKLIPGATVQVKNLGTNVVTTVATSARGPFWEPAASRPRPPLKLWSGIRDALQLAAPSPQPGRTGSAGEPAPAEDCLFLNVWPPGPAGRKRPVMFYSHGGGSAYQDGANLARTWDVVVVASNHRLGLMGYLYLSDLGGPEYATRVTRACWIFATRSSGCTRISMQGSERSLSCRACHVGEAGTMSGPCERLRCTAESRLL